MAAPPLLGAVQLTLAEESALVAVGAAGVAGAVGALEPLTRVTVFAPVRA